MEYERKFVNASYRHTTLKTELPFGLHNAACESPNNSVHDTEPATIYLYLLHNIMNDSLQGTILIVDDVEENLMISSAILKKAGFIIHTAKSGADCIRLVPEIMPNLILLDINMPGMNGIEACTLLKQDEVSRDIPIIFLTAISESSHIVRAFQAGGMDYILKPFRTQELLARVQVHLALQYAQGALRDQNKHLEQLNKEKSEFLGIAAHDLKNPLSGIIGLSEMIALREEIGIPDTEITDMAQQIKQSSHLMFEIVANLLDVNRIEEGDFKLFPRELNIYELCSSILTRYESASAKKNITLIHTPITTSSGTVFADDIASVQVLDNIISNAIKYSPHGKTVSVIHEVGAENFLRVRVKDQGQGLTDDDKKLLFQKFSKLSARPTNGEHSTGLGLSIAKKLADLMNVAIYVESEYGNGATFVVDFPIPPPRNSGDGNTNTNNE
jgi:two-component system, sensor histidine kinase and response regulator